MPISSVVDKTCGQMRTTVTGSVTVKEILDHLATVQREQLLPFSEFIDARQVGKPYLSADDLWQAAGAVRAVKLTPPLGPRAVVVGDATNFGLVRIFATILSGYFPINVFRDEKAAMEWLSVQRRFQYPSPSQASPLP